MNLINQLTMSSREIAKLTGKQHKDVMRDIRVMFDQLEIDSAHFCAQYKDATGRNLPCFNLNRYHTEILVTGYDIKRRAAVIKRWYDLETAKPQLPDFSDPVAAARAWADAEEGKRAAMDQLEAAKPAMQFVDSYVNATGLKGFREVCKLLGVKEPVFRDFLSRNKIMYRIGNSKQWTAYQNHVDAGRFDTKTGERNGHAYNECKFTPKGVAWVSEQWKKEQEQ